MRIKGIKLVGLVIMILSLLVEVGLHAFTLAGTDKNSPVIVLCGMDEDALPDSALRLSFHRAGFDYVRPVKDLTNLEENESISLPTGYKGRKMVIFARGTYAVEAMRRFDSDEDVLGFVLVNPVIESSYLIEGMSNSFPTHDVAIFSGQKGERTDSQILYERLTGEDTLFGISYKTGGLFSSKTYTNPDDNRYLSINASGLSSGNDVFFSPVVQIEMARYLAVNYSVVKDFSAFSILFWYILLVIFSVSFFVGLLLFLSKSRNYLPSMNTESDKVENVSLISATLGGVIATLAIVIMSIVQEKHTLATIGILALPLIVLLFAATIRLFYVTSNLKYLIKTRIDYRMTFLLLLLVVPFVLLTMLNAFGFVGEGLSLKKIILVASAVVVDFCLIILSASSDTVSRNKYKKTSSYLERSSYLFITCGFLLILCLYGMIFCHFMIALYSLYALIYTLLSYISSVLIRKHTNSNFVSAITHSAIYLLFLLFMA